MTNRKDSKRRAYLKRRSRIFHKRQRQIRERRERIRKHKNLFGSYHKDGKSHASRIPTMVSKPKPKSLDAPQDFRLLSNPIKCSRFLRSLLHMENAVDMPYGLKQIRIGIRHINNIDFASTMMLNAIEEELALNQCNVKSRLPREEKSRKYLIDSGYLNKKYDENGRMIINPGDSLVMDIQRGEELIKVDHVRSFISLMNKVYSHFGEGKSKHHDSYISMLKEICGNSAEWGDIKRKNWTIGAKFESDKVVFVALDLGIGILNSLNRNFFTRFADKRQSKNDCQILEGAFREHYSSKSDDPNRNQGLPFIRECNEKLYVKDLSVITNNVILFFDDSSKTQLLSQNYSMFPGTLYSWTIDKECILKQ